MLNPKSCLKSISAILIFFSFQQMLFSQSAFTIGVKGGVISNRYIIPGESMSTVATDSRAGLEIGITTQLFKSKYFALIPEINYLQRGMGPDSNEFGLPSGKTFASYLSFTMLPSFRIENRILSPFIYLGPRFEILLSHNSGNAAGFSDKLENGNFGFSSGLGFEKKITQKLNITTELRYSLDFTEFVGTTTVGQEPIYYKNSSFDFLLGVNYALGGSIK